VPCYVLLVRGEEVDRINGATTRVELERLLAKSRGAAAPAAVRATPAVAPAVPGIPVPARSAEAPLALEAAPRALPYASRALLSAHFLSATQSVSIALSMGALRFR
jgi:hypothetical protein